jgi:hypothetical protein
MEMDELDLLYRTRMVLREKRGSLGVFQKRTLVLHGISSIRRRKVYGKNRLS